jgi:hypothetical protein
VAKRKKSRTPAPPRRPAAPKSGTEAGSRPAAENGPRPVQAPKVRAKRRSEAELERRNRMILYGAAGTGVLGLVAALLAVFVIGKGGNSTAHFDGPNVDFANLPGLIKTPPPWKKTTKELESRLKGIGVQLLPTEGNVLHIHQHLDIFVNGKHVTVPALIGIKVKGQSPEFAELHTHDTDGVIHLESARAQAFSLGQFFGTWGVYLAPNCVGGLCSPPDPIAFYVNGTKVKSTEDPAQLVLQQHDEIAIVYGTPPAKIPSSYTWPAGE